MEHSRASCLAERGWVSEGKWSYSSFYFPCLAHHRCSLNIRCWFTTQGLSTYPSPPNFHIIIFRNHKTSTENRMKTTLIIYMEPSMSSTIPAGINCPVLSGRQYSRMWQKGKDEKGRGRNATSNNMAGLAGSQPTPSPIDQIFTEQQAERKGRGQSLVLHSDATWDSGNSCTAGNAPASSQLEKHCASSSLRAPVANPYTLFGQPIARD